MSYLVLARKWRPKRLQDLLGQDHVAVTLRNAITSDRVAHAFLFSGVRGVGKTSAARILSMALNCENSEGPTPDPCGVCEACTRISSSSCVDVQEIDGASNNSVDDVRNLRETVAYRPASCRTKVYIIDEVHMLSQSAFNALLKTLEEPPPHVKFIFATTEPHRIPITILSRCQSFDFRKIPSPLIEKQIAAILQEEKISMEPDAVTVIAREAAGSMRDALSLLDQIIAAYGKKIKSRDVYDLLGIVGAEVNINLSKAVISRDVTACLDIVHRLDQEGYNLLRFMDNYLIHIRDMIVIKAAGKGSPGLALASWEIDAIAELVQPLDLPELYRLFTTVSKTLELAPYSPYPKILLETTLIKLSQQESLATIDKILQRLGELKKSGALRAPSPRTAAPAMKAEPDTRSGNPERRPGSPARPKTRRRPPPRERFRNRPFAHGKPCSTWYRSRGFALPRYSGALSF
jgi:DNA polymerase-3 subunit gamma/tau